MSRMTGYWWSGDETKIAYTRVDETPVKEAIRNEIYADEVNYLTNATRLQVLIT